MANVYVASAAVGAGTGVDWANAFTTLQAAIVGKVAGDIFYVAHDHIQTQATDLVLAFPGVTSNPNKIYCANRLGSAVPQSIDLRTTAQILTTTNADINISGTCDFYGLIFSAGSGAVEAQIFTANGNNYTQRFTNCSLRLGSTHTDAGIYTPNYNNAHTILENTTIQFGASNNLQSLYMSGRLTWRNTPNAILGANIPTNLLDINAILARALIEGVDFSAVPSGRTLFYNRSIGGAQVIMKDCKLGAGVTVAVVNTNTFANTDYQVINCDSGDTNYRTERVGPYGSMAVDRTIVHNGGASDGTNGISWKIATSSIVKWEFPFECYPIVIWNEIVDSARTVTIQGAISGAGSMPNSDEIWIDVEYLGTSGFPLAVKATSTKPDGLAIPQILAVGTGTWTGSPTILFSMSATFIPKEKGPITIYVRAAKPSLTYYIDPKPVLA